MQFTNSVVIDRPIPEVFAFVSDFKNMSMWNYFVIETTNESDGTQGIGTTYRQRRKTDAQRYVVTEYERDRRVVIRTLPPAPDLQMRFQFESAGGGTRLTDEWQLQTGLPGWLERVGTARIRSAARENLAKLKELLETGRVRLQDGRVEQLRSRSLRNGPGFSAH
jgi:uncharacterized protein YndB with AHSA1/START domain